MMKAKEMLDILGSFVTGFGSKDEEDINNAVYIAIELDKLNLPLDFKGAGRVGVESLDLYGLLVEVKPNQKRQEAYYIGKMFSNFDSQELMLVASYLWDEGRSSLYEEEREKASHLLQEKFGMTMEEGRIVKPSSALASG